MVQKYIEIRGARENNLKDVSLRLPKRNITMFTGVSGSGKSSMVFDTIANEAAPALFAHRSTLRGLCQRLFLQRSTGHVPGMHGLGRKIGIPPEALIDTTKSLNEGAVIAPGLAGWESDLYGHSGFFDNNKKIAEYTPEELDLLLYSEPRKHTGLAYNTYEGLVYKFNRKFVARDIQTLSSRIRQQVEPFLKLGPCPLCKGARLNQAALNCKINGYNIAEFAAMEVDELIGMIKEIKEPAAAPMVRTLTERLQHLVDIGLEYLSLDRPTDTLSGGESQRVKMVKHLNGSLVDVMYIFDEPSVGLHPRDVHRLNELLEKLRDKGNTVIVVEHDPDVIKVADYVVDMGPYAGSEGGQVVYEGSFAGLLKADTLTGNHLQSTRPLKDAFRQATGTLPIVHATVNNLKDVSVTIPAGVLTVVTGVAGSGKSSLITEAFLSQHRDAVVIDQSPMSTSSRSNPATYTGVMDEVRKAFAAVNRVDAGLFSFNSKGACSNCQGLGVTYTDLGFLEGVKLPCEVCGGKRFKDEVLAYTLNGKSIADVLNLTVHQALAFLTMKEVQSKLQALSDVGLDYLTLGQPLSTLSGGECQRMKLASELHKQGSIYVMDEPTTGLHLSDIGRLLTIMNRLVDGGNTVMVIEHHLDVIRNADWIIDMGPEGGNKGGMVIFEGTPRELLGAKHSLTSQYVG
jgi:excinuclease UvrABC ATPase subunit